MCVWVCGCACIHGAASSIVYTRTHTVRADVCACIHAHTAHTRRPREPRQRRARAKCASIPTVLQRPPPPRHAFRTNSARAASVSSEEDPAENPAHTCAPVGTGAKPACCACERGECADKTGDRPDEDAALRPLGAHTVGSTGGHAAPAWGAERARARRHAARLPRQPGEARVCHAECARQRRAPSAGPSAGTSHGPARRILAAPMVQRGAWRLAGPAVRTHMHMHICTHSRARAHIHTHSLSRPHHLYHPTHRRPAFACAAGAAAWNPA